MKEATAKVPSAAQKNRFTTALYLSLVKEASDRNPYQARNSRECWLAGWLATKVQQK